jgi:predicted enzyme related to lactoylglutathione lyase
MLVRYRRGVTLNLFSVTFDCEDPEKLAGFWSQVTGYDVTTAFDGFAELRGDGSAGPRFMFMRVPEPKTAKNRMHIDLGTADLEAEVERVLGLGATLVGRHEEYGVTWATFRDPEGNEFCIGLHP